MYSKTTILKVLPVIILLAGFGVVWAIRRTPPSFEGTTSITFTERGFDQPDKQMHVTDPKEVHRIVSSIHLARKDPCPCVHIHNVTFEKAAERIEVSICDHCFAVLIGKQNGWYPNVRDYSMPREFYAEFRRLTLSRTNEAWHVQRESSSP